MNAEKTKRYFKKQEHLFGLPPLCSKPLMYRRVSAFFGGYQLFQVYPFEIALDFKVCSENVKTEVVRDYSGPVLAEFWAPT